MNSGLLKINPQTKISALIKANEMVIDALAALNPHFNKLRNAALRKLLAGRVTIEDACKISGCKVEDFMMKMAEIGFEVGNSILITQNKEENKPEIYHNLEAVTLDVRPMLANREDPLDIILKATDRLVQGQCLKLINTFEPIPLIRLLSKKGFSCYTERPDAGLVISWFVKDHTMRPGIQEIEVHLTQSQLEFDLKLQSFKSDKLETIDVRELEMPLPMLTILDHLENLPADKALFVLHKKIPVYLLSELQERGFKYLLQETGDEKVNMLIYKS